MYLTQQVRYLTKLWNCVIKTQHHLTSSKEKELPVNALHLKWSQSLKINKRKGGIKIWIMLLKAPYSMTLTKKSSAKHNQRANHRMAALVQHLFGTKPMFT